MSDIPIDSRNLREDLFEELLFMAGVLGYYGMKGDAVLETINKQVELLEPIVKRHIKRAAKAERDKLKSPAYKRKIGLSRTSSR